MNWFYYTFLGLNTRYYLKNLLVASIFAIAMWWGFEIGQQQFLASDRTDDNDISYVFWWLKAYVVISLLLYPYAKYAYDCLWDYFSDEDSWWVVGGFLLIVVYWFKFFMRLMLFVHSIIIAPIGLLVLYLKNR